MQPSRIIAAVLLIAAWAPGARADDVMDQINEAITAYQKHDLQTAVTALDAAADLLRQGRADQLKALLPAAPPGWTAKEVETSAVGLAALGGGLSAGRTYTKDGQQVEVQITMNSPVMRGLAAMLASPIAAVGGMKTVVFGGRRLSYMPDENMYMALIGDRVVVKVSGDKDVPDATLKLFLAGIDFPAAETLGRLH